MFLFLIFFAKFREKELQSQSKHFKANCSFQFEFLRQKRSYTSTTNFQNWSPVTVGLKSQKPHLPSSTEMASYAAAHRGMAPFCVTEQSFLSLVSPRKGFVMLPRRVLGSWAHSREAPGPLGLAPPACFLVLPARYLIQLPVGGWGVAQVSS